jgi:hypothetical protein
MSEDLSIILALKRVLQSVAEGEGVARSVVEGLGGHPPPGSESARMLLLGYPLTLSLRPMMAEGSDEASMLASLLVSSTRSSATLVGRTGEEFATTLERWVKVREGSRMEQKVLRFRSIITSGVLGAVTAMVASLGPLVGNLSFGSGEVPVDPATLLYAAAGMTAMSSAMLGYFMSGRSFVVNVLVATSAFALVGVLASPLASVPSAALWGVK